MSQRPRLTFLDNLRWIMIARVVAFHVGAGYSGYSEFFIETQAGGAVGLVRNIIAALPGMNILFFVAGFFALPSLLRRGTVGFVRGKLLILCVPYLLCVFFLGPLMPFLGFYSQSYAGLESDSYWAFWSHLLATGFHFELARTVFTTNTQFHPMHYWFLSELLQFLLLLALGRAAWRRWGTGADGDDTPAAGLLTPEPSTARVPVRALLVAALAMTAAQIAVALADLPGGLFLGILQLEPSSWIGHAAFFALGVYAYRAGWFLRLAPPGWAAFGIFLGLLVAIGGAGFGLYQTLGESAPRWLFDTLGSLFLTVGGIWFLIVCVGLTWRYMNRPSPVTAALAQASYPVYLLHYPLILVFRLFLLTVDVPTPVKALTVFLLAGSSSVFLGLYLLRSRPRLAVAALLGLHLVMLSVGLPRTSWSHQLLDRAEALHAVVPEQRPRRVAAGPELDELDGMSWATPAMRVAWTGDRLYVAGFPDGLLQVDGDGHTTPLRGDVTLGALAPAPAGLYAVDRDAGTVLHLDETGRTAAVLLDSSHGLGTPHHLAAAPDGRLYVSAGQADSAAIYTLDADTLRPVAPLAGVRGLALSTDGGTLFATASGDIHVHAFDVAADGSLGAGQPVAELFRGDARYGRTDLQRSADAAAEGLTVDAAGRLFVTSRHGVQVFAADGALLGVVDFPDVPLEWDRVRPLTVAFGGADGGTLYVSCGAEVYAVSVRYGD